MSGPEKRRPQRRLLWIMLVLPGIVLLAMLPIPMTVTGGPMCAVSTGAGDVCEATQRTDWIPVYRFLIRQ